MDILNLDSFIAADKVVKYGGKEYKLPAELPVRMMLKLMKVGQEIATNNADTEAYQHGLDLLVEVFKIRTPTIDKTVFDNLSPSQYGKLVNYIYAVQEPDIQGE